MAKEKENKDALTAVLRNIEKSIGHKGNPIFMRFGDKEEVTIPCISFGVKEVDDASCCGGIPRGKMVEIFGPESGGKSLLSLKLIASAQSAGLECALADIEQSFDAKWATKHGVNADKLVIGSDFDCGEQALDYVLALCDSGAFGLVVVDSTAALVPKREIEGDIGDSTIGELARMMSKACRQIIQSCGRTNTTCIFINQIRDKIGVMFGCFHYNARVILEDGSSEKIGKIVNNKINTRVMSYNPSNGKIEPKRILQWHNNGNIEDDGFFLQIIAEKNGKNGITNIPCTPNHVLFKNEGFSSSENRYIGKEIMAKDLEVGEEILIAQPYYSLSPDQKQVIYGSILGDGSLRSVSKGKNCLQLRIGHGHAQREYAQWKKEIIDNLVSYVEDKKERYCFDTFPMYELSALRYKSSWGKNVYNIIPKEVANEMSAMGLAIWYLDDGSFGGSYAKWGNGRSVIYCLKFTNRETMMPFFNKMGLTPKLIPNRGFVFDSENTDKLHQIIAPFVPPCMEYKIHPKYRGKYSYEIKDDENVVEYKAVPSKIIDIYEKPQTKTKRKFDLTVEDNATYLIDGAIVHNSPETTPGGRALKFYSHQRIKVWPKSRIKMKADNKEIVVAQISSVKFVKNKVASPFGECEFKIVFNETAANPVVMLCNEAKTAKIISTYKKEFRIDKEPTGCYDISELADYVIKNNLVLDLIEKVEKDIEENPMDKENNERVLDDAILEMKTDPSKIVSPNNDTATSGTKINESGTATAESEA